MERKGEEAIELQQRLREAERTTSDTKRLLQQVSHSLTCGPLGSTIVIR